MSEFRFCKDLFIYNRRISRVIKIGNKPLGYGYPLRIQSMTNTDPTDIAATTDQIIELYEAGCDYVRLTIPSVRDTKNLKLIREKLHSSGIIIPLIADVHFNPEIAELCAGIVEKVRINPGNYSDKKHLRQKSFTEKEYEIEFEKVYDKLKPLISICKEHGTVLRIGTNHGSLSDRIMSRYGDTIEGMVESTLEYVRICRDLNFHELVLSIKSSNPIMMIDAYRLLVTRMTEECMDYPIHLGVTEAGEGEEGRIKSATGIGALLEDGIGDTIRVSLAEHPVKEIPVARMIAFRYDKRNLLLQEINTTDSHLKTEFIQNFIPGNDYYFKNNIRKDKQAIVIADLSRLKKITKSFYQNLCFIPDKKSNSFKMSYLSPDFIYIGDNDIIFPNEIPLKLIINYNGKIDDDERIYYLYSISDYLQKQLPEKFHFIKIKNTDFESITLIEKIKSDPFAIVLLDLIDTDLHQTRLLFYKLWEAKVKNNIILLKNIEKFDEQTVIDFSIEAGSMLADGMGNGLCISSKENVNKCIEMAFNILQAVKRRIFKTEYVICPTCGRTQFPLQLISEKIKAATSHLKGLKIGIMGCIVNGLGEMGDADYGLVGSGKGKVNLYRNKELVKKNINIFNATDELISLIKKDNRWTDILSEMV